MMPRHDHLLHEHLLHEHMVHDHGRAAHEIAGLPLTAVHELEHFDETLGLLDLRHRHGPRSGLR
ncbi:MAG: hypothetical protein ACRDV1_10510 [Actinomycetes bacterium]